LVLFINVGRQGLSIQIDKSHTLEQQEESEILGEEIPYRQAVGCLLFLSQETRPDIAYAVNLVQSFLKNIDFELLFHSKYF